MGGALALLQDGDIITIDSEREPAGCLNVSDEEFTRRLASWQAPAPKYTKGVLYKVHEDCVVRLGGVRDGFVA